MVHVRPGPRPRQSFARDGSHEIRLTVGLTCAHCGRELHASDVTVDVGAVGLICTGCHRDVLTIGLALEAGSE
jgi:hypothetical protein